MGAGASAAESAEKIAGASPDELKSLFESLSSEKQEQIRAALKEGKSEGAPAGLSDCCMMCELKDFADWHQAFLAHGTSKTFTMAGKEFTVEMARGECCDDAKSLVFQDEANPNCIAIAMFAMDFPKFGPMMGSETFKEMSSLSIVSQDPPLVMTPPGPDGGPTPNMFFWVEVEDADKWIAGFKAHSTNKTHESWEGEAPLTRSEMCDDSKTRIFKCATNPKFVGAYCEAMNMEKLGPLLGDPGFAKLATSLGEKDGSKVMNVVKPMPPPPA